MFAKVSSCCGSMPLEELQGLKYDLLVYFCFLYGWLSVHLCAAHPHRKMCITNSILLLKTGKSKFSASYDFTKSCICLSSEQKDFFLRITFKILTISAGLNDCINMIDSSFTQLLCHQAWYINL